MVTLQQIAERAGVSRGTVDRALNNRGRINLEVAERIRKIAREMGYQPNIAGRALAMSRKPIKIGVIIQSCNTPFMRDVHKGVAAAKKEVIRLGADILVINIKEVDTEQVLRAMDELKDNGCNGIALVPTEDQRLKNKIDYFSEEEKIPIVTFNADIKGAKRLCFVGQNSTQSGKAAAGLMAEILPEGGSVQIISGYPANQAHKNRAEAFRKELAANRPNISIPEVQYGYDDNKRVEGIAEACLAENPVLSGIYLAASGAESVCRVLEEKNKVRTVKVVSNDLTPQNKQYLKKGIIQFLIDQNAYIQGFDPVMILFHKLFDGIDPDKEFLYTELIIKTKYNL